MGKHALYCLGLACASAWSALLYTDSVLLLPPRDLMPLEIVHLFSTFTNIVFALVLVALATRFTPLVQRREALYAVGVLGSLATIGIPMASAGLFPGYLFPVSMVISTMAGAWITICWYETLSGSGVQRALMYLMISSVLGLALAALISSFPVYVALSVAVPLPVAAVFCLRPISSRALVSYPEPDTRPAAKELITGVPLRIIIFSGIVNLAFGMAKTLQLIEGYEYGPTPFSVLQFIIEAAPFIIAGLIAFYAYQHNTVVAFYIAVPVIAVAALFMLAPDAVPYDISFFAASVGTRLIHILVLLLLIKTTLQKRLPLVFGLSLLTAIEFAGTLIGQMVTVLTAGNTLVLAVLLLLALIAAVMVLLGQSHTLAVEKPTNERPEAPSHDECVEQICDEFSLSPREREVLRIWIVGRNSAYIEHTLCISKNTVKTHLSHIYSKTGTSSREGLIDLLDEQK